MKSETYGLFHQPKNTLPRITEIYAFVSVDKEDGNEGVIAAPIGRTVMPLIAADKDRLEVLTQLAQQLSDAWKINIRVIKLTKREEIGFITPHENTTTNRT